MKKIHVDSSSNSSQYKSIHVFSNLSFNYMIFKCWKDFAIKIIALDLKLSKNVSSSQSIKSFNYYEDSFMTEIDGENYLSSIGEESNSSIIVNIFIFEK